MSNKLYAAVKSALISAFVLFAATLIGFLNQVIDWAGRDDTPFPDMSVLGKGLVAAVSGAAIGLVTYLVNAGQEKGVVPGKAAQYTPKPADPE